MTDAQAIAIIAAILFANSDEESFAGCLKSATQLLALAKMEAAEKQAMQVEVEFPAIRSDSILAVSSRFPCGCRGTGIRSTADSKGYCTCQLGKDLERLEKRDAIRPKGLERVEEKDFGGNEG